MLLMIDNYDSFTYNLVSAFKTLHVEVQVFRNDKITCDEIEMIHPRWIVLSPGPCTPEEAGISKEIVQKFHKKIPILGVCLGHQTIAAALGGMVIRAPEPVHGMQDEIYYENDPLFEGISFPMLAARYHSLIVTESHLPENLKIIARNTEGIIMAIKHKYHPCFGVQFHPESILTPQGIKLMQNFLRTGYA